jgi:hypothetical protein
VSRVRRSPGKGEAWVEKVWQATEHDRPKTFDRLRRRIGFAHRLGELAKLSEEDQAAVTIGLFLHVLIADTTQHDLGRPAPAWAEYFLRNIDWLTPAIDVCHSVQSPAWEEEDRLLIVVGQVSALFDQEILEDHKRPLEVMAALRADPPTAAVEAIASLLWTEEGQALCDRHFRRHPRNYKLDGATVHRAFERLRPAGVHSIAEIASQPLGLSTSLAQAASRHNGKQEAKSGRADIDPPVRVSDAFQRRRQALRGTSPIEGVPEEAEALRARHNKEEAPVEHHQPQEDTHASATDEDELTAKVNAIIERARDRAEEETPRAERSQEPAHEEPRHRAHAEHVEDQPVHASPRHEAHAEHQERDTPRRRPRTHTDEETDMDNVRSITAARAERRNDHDLTDKVDELRSQLRQVQRLAVQSEELLATMAPQIEEFASALSQIETMVQRFKGYDGADRDERVA